MLKGKTHTEETKKKMTESQLEKSNTENQFKYNLTCVMIMSNFCKDRKRLLRFLGISQKYQSRRKEIYYFITSEGFVNLSIHSDNYKVIKEYCYLMMEYIPYEYIVRGYIQINPVTPGIR